MGGAPVIDSTPFKEKKMTSFKGRHGRGNKGNFDSGWSKSKVCSYFPFTVINELRRDTVVETKTTLTVIRARVKCVHIFRLPTDMS